MAATYHSIISTVKMQGRSAWEYLCKFLLEYLTVAGIFFQYATGQNRIGNMPIVNKQVIFYVGKKLRTTRTSAFPKMKRFVSVKALFMAMVTGLLLAACGDDGVENAKPGGQGNGSVENRKIVAKIVEKSSSEGSVVWDGDIEEMSFSYDKQGRLTGITYSGDDDEEVDKVEYLYEKNSVRISLSTWLNGVEVSEEFDESRVALNEKGYAVSCVNSYYDEDEDSELSTYSFKCFYDSNDRLVKRVEDDGSYDKYTWKNGYLVRCVRNYATDWMKPWTCVYAYDLVKNNANIDLNYFLDNENEGALCEDMCLLGVAGLTGKRSEYMVKDFVNGNNCPVSLSYELDEDGFVHKVNSVLEAGAQVVRDEYMIIYKQ